MRNRGYENRAFRKTPTTLRCVSYSPGFLNLLRRDCCFRPFVDRICCGYLELNFLARHIGITDCRVLLRPDVNVAQGPVFTGDSSTPAITPHTCCLAPRHGIPEVQSEQRHLSSPWCKSVLKGHDLSRADNVNGISGALAPVERFPMPSDFHHGLLCSRDTIGNHDLQIRLTEDLSVLYILHRDIAEDGIARRTATILPAATCDAHICALERRDALPVTYGRDALVSRLAAWISARNDLCE